MTDLLGWRNPQGKEKEWVLFQEQNRGHYPTFIGKVIVAEIGLLLLCTTALIESVIYSVLTLISLTIYPCNNKPCKFFAKLLESSSFTIFWSFIDLLFPNPFIVNIITEESFARYSMTTTSLCCPLNFLYRSEDMSFKSEWETSRKLESLKNRKLNLFK